MVGVQEVLIRLASDLGELGHQWALVGGLAVSARAEPRTTRDVDVAVTTVNDGEAEKVVSGLCGRGYVLEALLERDDTGRLATARLLAPAEEPGGIVVDLLFVSSGVEPEIVCSAETLDLLPGLATPVATLGHLLALKTLAGRTKDLADIEALLGEATPADINAAIEERGCARNKNLQATLSELLARYHVAGNSQC